MLRIRQGSVFDEKCDLLVLPCNSGGGVTRWVQSEIERNNLSFPSGRIPFGKVMFVPTEARYPKADHVGYAASVGVAPVRSTPEAVASILASIVDYGRANGCSIVNLPLLGIGAGGLDPADVMEVYRARLSGEPGQFNVCIPDKAVADLFLDADAPPSAAAQGDDEHPRVFISYSWKDEAVKAWAFELATKLCAHGVDARLDRFHLKPGMDLPQWMTNEVLKARKVLLICDTHYAEKADMRRAGVGWETMIIQGDMMMQGEMNEKYIVVAYGDFEKNTPIYMKSKVGLHRDEIDGNFQRLLELIYEVDTAPEIGPVPAWVKARRKAPKA